MVDLFGVPWSELGAGDVERFLSDAGDEGINWEAKGDHLEARLRPASIQKAACGLANQIGGYLLIGAANPAREHWKFPGISPPSQEPELWIGQAVRQLQPAPSFEVKTWDRPDNKVAGVVRIEPVAVPPCMTPTGIVYQRVPLETLPVKDPVLLHQLFARGEVARELASQRSFAAADRALAVPRWRYQRCVGISVGISPIGRETDDISSRLFTEETRKAIAGATGSLLDSLGNGGNPDQVDARQWQDSFAWTVEFGERRDWGPGGKLLTLRRSTWLTQANWDGSVAASLTLNDGDLSSLRSPEMALGALWGVIDPLAAHLGGYGPAQLTALVDVTQTTRDIVIGEVVHAGGRVPPDDSFYARLGGRTEMGRLVDLGPPDSATVASLGRELRRAAGEIQDEPG